MIHSLKLRFNKFYKVGFVRLDGQKKVYFKGMRKGGYLK